MKIKIATDFSRIPGARYPEEGDFSGQEAIQEKVKLTIDLDGTAGLGTSFLEEAFGGLIREDRLDYNEIIGTLEFVSEEDPDYISEIHSYIDDAYEQEKKI